MLAAWGFVIVWISGVIMAERKHHPKALFVLFFTELWERFSYYGMRALLILYMTKALIYGDDKAYGIYGAYGALVYATPVLGGFLADRFLGYRKAIMLGAVLMAFGHFALAFEYEYVFYLALGFLVIGNGFFKPNISSLIGTFYEKGDKRRDAAFTLFYMGINTGAFLTPLTVGAIGELYGWHWGFAIAGVGMVLGLMIFIYGGKKGLYFDKGLPPVKKDSSKKETDWSNYIIAGAFLSVPLFALLVNQNEISKYLLYIVGFAVLLILLIMAFMEKKEEKERLFVILILFAFSTMFWTFFELAGSAITLFTDRNVERQIFGYLIPTSSFQGVNPFFIIVLAPLFAWIWSRTAKIGKEPSDPMKFSLSLIQLGIGFGMFVIGAKVAGPDALAPLIFLVLGYLFHTTGELCMSPIGLSLVTKLSPSKIVAFVMGVWLMSTSFAHLLGAEISKRTSLPSEDAAGPVTREMLQLGLKTYSDVFEIIAYISIASGIFLIFLVPLLKKWMHGIR
jgi:POT family proton-dependent oligopeptide transporter